MSKASDQQPGRPHDDRRRAARPEDPAKRAHHDAIFTLARASEMHDGDTGAHLVRIRRVVEIIARHMGFDPEDAEALGYDAMLHDVGKLNVPSSVLQKPDMLNDIERETMQSHTIRGERLLSSRRSMQRAARIARSHHEAWDGSGYPDGLAGEDIPLEARITAAADMLDALIAERCYKQAWPYEKALKEVLDLAGTRLDPRVTEAIAACNADGALCEVFGLTDRCVVKLEPPQKSHDAA